MQVITLDRKTIVAMVSLIAFFVVSLLLIIEKGRTTTNFELMEDFMLGVDEVEVSDRVDPVLLEEVRSAIISEERITFGNYVEFELDDGSTYRIQILYKDNGKPYIENISVQ